MHAAQRVGVKALPVGDRVLLTLIPSEHTRGVLVALDGIFVGGILINLSGWVRRDPLEWHMLHASTLASSSRAHPN